MNKTLKAFLGIVSATPILFLIWLIISFFLYIEVPIRIVPGVAWQDVLLAIGIIFILTGTALAFWAQKISRVVTDPKYKATCPDLMQGPYKYSRHPGSFSIILMSVGFAIVVNSLMMLILSAGLVILLTAVFVPIEEHIIGELCPEAYEEYRKKVRMWI